MNLFLSKFSSSNVIGKEAVLKKLEYDLILNTF